MCSDNFSQERVLMKKTFIFLFAAAVLTTIVSCTRQNTAQSSKIKITCTTFPNYDWTREITRGIAGIDLKLIVSDGTDLHSFQPSVNDIVTIQTTDILVFTGGESDEWVLDAIKNPMNRNLVPVNLMSHLSERLQREENEINDHECDHEFDDAENDEHIWLSLKNAQASCQTICTALCEKDPAHKDSYQQNTHSYLEKLSALDENYAHVISGSKKKSIVFADRFPFKYLASDYGLSHFAAFKGCAAETEASFQTIAILAQKLNELDLNCIIKIEGSSDSLSKTVLKTSGRSNGRILVLDSIQSVTKKQIDGGYTYLGAMESNLKVIQDALN